MVAIRPSGPTVSIAFCDQRQAANWQLAAQEETQRKGQDISGMTASSTILGDHDGGHGAVGTRNLTVTQTTKLEGILNCTERTLATDPCFFFDIYIANRDSAEATSMVLYRQRRRCVHMFVAEWLNVECAVFTT